MDTTKHIQVRLDAPLHKRLSEAAKAEKRSMNKQIILFIEQGLDRRGK